MLRDSRGDESSDSTSSLPPLIYLEHKTRRKREFYKKNLLKGSQITPRHAPAFDKIDILNLATRRTSLPQN